MDSTLRSSSRSRDREEEEYLRFRAIIIVGDLRLLRKELIQVLYKLYIKLLRTQISKIASKRDAKDKEKIRENIEAILKYKRDFLDIPAYAKELQYIEPVLKEMPDIESMKSDTQLAKIFTSSEYPPVFFLDLTSDRLHFVPELVHLRNFGVYDGETSTQVPRPVVVRPKEEKTAHQQELVYSCLCGKTVDLHSPQCRVSPFLC